MSALLTTREAAERLKVTRRALQQYCLRGALKATKAGRDWLISERDLARFAKPTRGRPRAARKAAAQHR